MKFNDKLIKLRKIKGLSQEELGYEINVTRQTISKWELGTTTPEMESLKEIARVFDVSIDILTDDTKELDEVSKDISSNSTNNNFNYNDIENGTSNNSNYVENDYSKNSKDGSNKKSVGLKVAIIIIIIILVIVIGGGILISNLMGNLFNSIGNIFEKAEENFSKVKEESAFSFNSSLERQGQTMGKIVSDLLLDVDKSNSTKQRQVELSFEGEIITDSKRIVEISKEIGIFDNYFIELEYDGEYISKIIITSI